jgi:hypothetical protein
MKPIFKDQPIEPIKAAQGLPCRRASMSVNLQKETSRPINRPAIAMPLDILVCTPRHRHVRVLPYTPITSADFSQWASGERQLQGSTLPKCYGSTKSGECFVEA